MDLSKLSDQDLAALQKGDLSSVSDEGLSHLHAQSMPEEPSLQGGRVGMAGGIADLVRPGFTKGAAHGAVEDATFGNVSVPDASDDPTGRVAGKATMMAVKGTAGGGLVNAATTGAGRIGLSALINGAQGALQKPAGDDSLTARAANGGIAALLGGGAQMLGEGASKAGDWVMQKAVGMKKYIPGMGQKMADEGIIGTKGMMRGQVERALPAREADLQNAVGQLEGSVSPEPVADALRAKADGYIPQPGSSGPLPVPSQNQPFVDAAHARAEEAFARGPLAPDEALSISRAVAKPAYSARSGEPLDSFKSQLSQTEGGTLKDALKTMGDEQGVPGVREALGQQAALLNAQRGLNRPESLQSIIGKLAVKGGAGAGLGYALGGTAGAVAGGLAATPAGQSTIGRAAMGAGGAAPYVTPTLIDALLSSKQQAGGQR